ncbi:MAG: copper chaperone [Armatimonadetes bacterium]|nr:MAG: copper chaperone [Armatimonadota bacterium]
MTDITLSVPDISCDHCKNSIEGALQPLDGVVSAEVSVENRNVAVTYDESSVDVATMVKAIDEQGYEVANT